MSSAPKSLYYTPVPVILLLDLITKNMALSIYGGQKTLIVDWVSIRVIRNFGIVFGVGAGPDGLPNWLVVGVVLVLTGGLIYAAVKAPGTKPARHLGFACMIGGALANVADRIVHGFVVDFIDIRGLPTFNLADAALLVGMLLVLYHLFFDAQDG